MASRCVLIVDDNADVALMMAELLAHEGCRVHVATSGKQAISLAQKLQPDVVLCDLGLPDLDGLEVARALRAECGGTPPRLVAVSGNATAEGIAVARHAGFATYLVKPACSNELIAAVLSPKETGKVC